MEPLEGRRESEIDERKNPFEKHEVNFTGKIAVRFTMLKQEVPEAAPLITAKYFRQNRYAVF